MHPFREGNGRTLRIFFDTLATNASYKLDWKRTDRKEYLEASIQSFHVDDSKMVDVFKKISIPLSRKKLKKTTINLI